MGSTVPVPYTYLYPLNGNTIPVPIKREQPFVGELPNLTIVENVHVHTDNNEYNYNVNVSVKVDTYLFFVVIYI